jgi:hypothetical protein
LLLELNEKRALFELRYFLHGGARLAATKPNQQALHQALQPLFEPEFSESSYGFRP